MVGKYFHEKEIWHDFWSQPVGNIQNQVYDKLVSSADGFFGKKILCESFVFLEKLHDNQKKQTFTFIPLYCKTQYLINVQIFFLIKILLGVFFFASKSSVLRKNCWWHKILFIIHICVPMQLNVYMSEQYFWIIDIEFLCFQIVPLCFIAQNKFHQ